MFKWKKYIYIFRTDTELGKIEHKATMRLTIFNVKDSDYKEYKCVARNSRGETDGSIKLYGKYMFYFSANTQMHLKLTRN